MPSPLIPVASVGDVLWFDLHGHLRSGRVVQVHSGPLGLLCRVEIKAGNATSQPSVTNLHWLRSATVPAWHRTREEAVSALRARICALPCPNRAPKRLLPTTAGDCVLDGCCECPWAHRLEELDRAPATASSRQHRTP